MLLRAWHFRLVSTSAALVLVGGGPIRARAVATGAAVRNSPGGSGVGVASVLSLMPRLPLIALLALLLAATPALADSTRNKILRECQNGELTGDYTAREIRDARNNIPDDLDQYTDCRDVLSRALLALTGGSGDGGGSDVGAGGGTTSGGGGGGGAGTPLTPSTEADHQALEQAATAGNEPIQIAGRNVTPGAALRNDLPTTLLVLLILLAVAAAAALAPYARRHALPSLAWLRQRVIPGRPG